MLTESEKRAFFEDGYVVVRELIDGDELETRRERYADLVLGRAPEFPERHISRRDSGQAPVLELPDPHGERHHRRGTQVFPKGEELTRHSASSS